QAASTSVSEVIPELDIRPLDAQRPRLTPPGRDRALLLEFQAALLRAQRAVARNGPQGTQGARQQGDLGTLLQRHGDPRRLLDVLAPDQHAVVLEQERASLWMLA